jgi:hypothetical protein
LKGDIPGMTLKQFRANHKHADCSNRTARQIGCRVYDGVSFAGVIATTFKGCTSPECSRQGIFAVFFDGRLVRLSYDVSYGNGAIIIQALKEKFGDPTVSAKTSATWRNSVAYLSVSEMAAGTANGPTQYFATDVTSALNDSGESKDI